MLETEGKRQRKGKREEGGQRKKDRKDNREEGGQREKKTEKG